MPTTSDCELIRDAFLTQPINAVSSVAFVVVGLLILRSRPILGILAAGVGVGSFLFHGPMPGWAQWGHDVSLAALIAGIALESQRRKLAVVVGLMAIVFALNSGTAAPVTAAVVVWVAISVGGRLLGRPSMWNIVTLVTLAASLVVFALSRTDGPLCTPDSILQGHAVWHVLAAGALLSYSQVDPRVGISG
jgi:hypothetical protein